MAACSTVWVTATQLHEAQQAIAVGADALILQGSEAGGHRGGFVDDDRDLIPLLGLLDAVRLAVPEETTLIAAGALMTAEHVAEVLALGAAAAQCGTAFLLSSEAGTDVTHKIGVSADGATVITRAFTGRRARGLCNDWTSLVQDRAPHAYPKVMEMTAPIRKVGRDQGDMRCCNLWAGGLHGLAEARPAGEIVKKLAGGGCPFATICGPLPTDWYRDPKWLRSIARPAPRLTPLRPPPAHRCSRSTALRC